MKNFVSGAARKPNGYSGTFDFSANIFEQMVSAFIIMLNVDIELAYWLTLLFFFDIHSLLTVERNKVFSFTACT